MAAGRERLRRVDLGLSTNPAPRGQLETFEGDAKIFGKQSPGGGREPPTERVVWLDLHSSTRCPRMDRRTFIIDVAIGLLAAPLAATAQQARTARIGWLAIEPLPELIGAFRQGLRDGGYVESPNLVIEERYARGRVERLDDLAAELVQLKLDALMTIGTAATVAAQHATTTLPIVFVVGDPVAAGFAASLSHPGGNLT